MQNTTSKTNTSTNSNKFDSGLGSALMRSSFDTVQMARTENEMKRSLGMPDASSSIGARKMAIEQIRIDVSLRPRVDLNPLLADQYAQLMRDGIVFPPITVFFDEIDHWLADGFYRLQAFHQNRQTSADVVVRQGTARDARLFAIEANRSHGARLTTADKRHAILTLLNDPVWSQWSSHEIARRCGASDGTVRKYRKELLSASTENTRTCLFNRGGKTHPMSITGFSKTRSLDPQTLELARALNLVDDPKSVSALTALPEGDRLPVLTIIRDAKADSKTENPKTANPKTLSVAEARVELRRQRQQDEKAANLADRRRQAQEAGYDDHFVHGDCTEVLGDLQPNSVRLLLADGPYGVNHSNSNRVATAASAKISNDRCLADALDVHKRMLKAIEKAMLPDCHVLLFCDKKYEPEFRKVAEDAGYKWRNTLIWYKGSHGRPIRNQASRCYETILWFTKGRPYLIETINDVLEFARPSSDPDAPETSHSTPKPVPLMAKLISATTVVGELVVDPFAGQASTLVAAKELGRSYFGVEEDKDWFGEGQANLQTKLSGGCSVATLAANSYQGEMDLAA